VNRQGQLKKWKIREIWNASIGLLSVASVIGEAIRSSPDSLVMRQIRTPSANTTKQHVLQFTNAVLLGCGATLLR